jgi:hypothetical protein
MMMMMICCVSGCILSGETFVVMFLEIHAVRVNPLPANVENMVSSE